MKYMILALLFPLFAQASNQDKLIMSRIDSIGKLTAEILSDHPQATSRIAYRFGLLEQPINDIQARSGQVYVKNEADQPLDAEAHVLSNRYFKIKNSYLGVGEEIPGMKAGVVDKKFLAEIAGLQTAYAGLKSKVDLRNGENASEEIYDRDLNGDINNATSLMFLINWGPGMSDAERCFANGSLDGNLKGLTSNFKYWAVTKPGARVVLKELEAMAKASAGVDYCGLSTTPASTEEFTKSQQVLNAHALKLADAAAKLNN